jgi:hypothetical protein
MQKQSVTAGPDVSIIEWDGVDLYPGDGSYPIMADFEVVIFSTPDPVYPEFVFACNNVDQAVIDLLPRRSASSMVGSMFHSC